MKLSQAITKGIDFVYVKPIRKIIPKETFRYVVCGGANLLLGWIIYTLVYKYVVDGLYLDLRFVVVSPHVLTLFIQFPVTFFTGFWLNRYVTFSLSPLSCRTQLVRYILQTAGSFLLNYLLLKLSVEALHIYPPVAKPITDLIVVIYSYLTARFFTFHTPKTSR